MTSTNQPPDWAEQEAEKLPCSQMNVTCLLGKPHHGNWCPAAYRSVFAAALREAEARGYRRGVEEAARVAYENYSAYSVCEAIRALLPAETEGKEQQ